MSEKHRPYRDAGNKLFDLDELDDDEDSDEEITGVTYQAIVDPKSDSTFALFRYVRKKHSGLSKRVRRIEHLVIGLFAAGTTLAICWEVFKAMYLGKK